MNIIQKVTLRQLKENKRRSLVTIIGVIISVAMITAVSTLGVSFLDLMIRQNIATSGEWHVQYKDVTEKQIEAIDEDSETEKLILSSDGYAALEESINPYKPYLYIKNYNKTGMEQFPIEVLEGRLPNKADEIVISEAIGSNAKVDYKIGDQLTLDIGDRWHKTEGVILKQNDSLARNEEDIIEELQVDKQKTVNIVGIIERPTWEPSWSPGYTVIGYVDEHGLHEGESLDAYVVVDKVTGSIYDHATQLAEENGIASPTFNSDLLRFHGVTANDNLRTTLYSLLAIIMGVIIVGSVALIYNAFAISVSERARHLGMLSSVGATKKQKRNSVFFEGAVIGVISIPIGIIAGLLGIGATFVFINANLHEALGVSEKLELVVTAPSLLLACGISILTIFISTYIPAQRASKISAIDAIRQTQDIKLTGKTVKTSKLVRKIFGLAAEIGLKNVKRNKKRYYATVFSLVISIVLFLSVSYFTDDLKRSLEMTQADLEYDIQVYSSGKMDNQELMKFAKLEHVTQSTIVKEVNLETHLEMDEIPEYLRTQIEENNWELEDGKYAYYVVLHALDQASFHQYAKQVGVDPNEFTKQTTPSAIVIEETTYESQSPRRLIETKTIESEVGISIDLYTFDYGDSEDEEPVSELVSRIQIGALTTQLPIGVSPASLGGISLIIPETMLDQLGISKELVNPYIYLNTTDPMATQTAIEDLKDPNIYTFNVYQQRQRGEQMVLLLSVFTYGFIALISLISIANIFNTISTSISLRKREFAMLRSVGMTPTGFNKMIRYESIFYGIKALSYGLPISILVMFGIHRSVGNTFEYGFQLPWISILIAVIFIFVIVGTAMLYSTSKIKNENIIESLKQENI